MTDLKTDLDSALGSEDEISRELVLSWIDDAQDLETLSKLYRLTGEGYSRIRPELGLDATCALIQRYLLIWSELSIPFYFSCHRGLLVLMLGS